MNNQLNYNLKIYTMCKHPDLLYVSAVTQSLYHSLSLSLSIYKSFYLYFCVCYSNLTKTPKKNTISTTSTTIKQLNNNNKQTNNNHNYHI